MHFVIKLSPSLTQSHYKSLMQCAGIHNLPISCPYFLLLFLPLFLFLLGPKLQWPKCLVVQPFP